MKKILFLIFLSSIFFSCKQNENTTANKEADLINSAKLDFHTKFNSLNHYGDYLSTPLWDEYDVQQTNFYHILIVPFEKKYDHISPYLYILTKGETTSYYVRIVNPLKGTSEDNIMNLFIANNDNKTLLQGYMENGDFIQIQELALTDSLKPQTKDMRNEGICAMCHGGWYGGQLPEVVVTPEPTNPFPPIGFPDYGSGGGSWIYSPPSIEPSDPCANLRNKGQISTFVSGLASLKSVASGKYESALSYTYDNGKFNFTNRSGNLGSPEITYAPSKSAPIDGFLHTHYQGILPTFSVSDILVPYYWHSLGGIKNLETFSLGLVTKDGTYFLQVDDVAKYKAFGADNTTNMDRGILESLYKNIFKITPSVSGREAANSLAKFLKDRDTGLVLLERAETTASKYYKKNVDSKNNVTDIDCR